MVGWRIGRIHWPTPTPEPGNCCTITATWETGGQQYPGTEIAYASPVLTAPPDCPLTIFNAVEEGGSTGVYYFGAPGNLQFQLTILSYMVDGTPSTALGQIFAYLGPSGPTPSLPSATAVHEFSDGEPWGWITIPSFSDNALAFGRHGVGTSFEIEIEVCWRDTPT